MEFFAIMAWVAGLWREYSLSSFETGLCPLYHLHDSSCCGLWGHSCLQAKVRVMPFFKGMTDAMTLAASTTSSSATLPATLHCVEENLGVSKSCQLYSSFRLNCKYEWNGHLPRIALFSSLRPTELN